MKKELFNCSKAVLMCLAMALSLVIALGCLANIVAHFGGIPSTHVSLNLEDSLCYFTVASSNIVMTITYLKAQ